MTEGKAECGYALARNATGKAECGYGLARNAAMDLRGMRQEMRNGAIALARE